MHDDVAALAHSRLRKMIDRPEWSGGGRLPAELELARTLGVSRPILRRALAQLREEGRVLSRRGSGNFVQPRVTVSESEADFRTLSIRTVSDMRHCLKFRLILEAAAAAEAARRADEAACEAMAEANRRLARDALTGSLFEADFDFHLALARASGNPYIQVTLQSLRPQIKVAYEFSRSLRNMPLNETSRRVVAEHEEVLRAVRARTPAAAEKAATSHVQRGMQRLFGDDL